MSVYTSIYALLIVAPDVNAVRKRLALLCGEQWLSESLTYGQLLGMLGALEEHEENAALSDEIRNIQKHIHLSYKSRKQGFESACAYLSTVCPLVNNGGSGACKLR